MSDTARAEADGLKVALAGRVGPLTLDVAFTAPSPGVTALFGPSGSGKTSVLRAIAGLSRLEGEVAVAGTVWQDRDRFVPPHRRAVGYVFQEASLFPHLTVERNLLYGARRTRGGIDAARREETVEMLGLGPLLARSPGMLSGGERQRVALGRAILTRPDLLLMDEPLSALDRMAKDEILPYLEALHGTLRIPILYVSHDLAEVERLADRIVVMRDGRVEASGPLNAALTDAGLGFLRDPHSAAVLPATVVGYDETDHLAELDVGGQRLLVEGSGAGEIGTRRRLRIEASDVSLSRERPALSTILNRLDVAIERIDPSTPANLSILLSLQSAPDLTFLARVTRRSARRLDLKPGDRLHAQIKSVSLATARAARR